MPTGRIELPTPSLPRRCSSTELRRHMVGAGRLELPTSRLSAECSYHLSYAPKNRKPETFPFPGDLRIPPHVRGRSTLGDWCRRRDLNSRPSHYECAALPSELRRHVGFGGARGDRTPDLLRATQALSHLSYGPKLVGRAGFEPATSCVSSRRSTN